MSCIFLQTEMLDLGSIESKSGIRLLPALMFPFLLISCSASLRDPIKSRSSWGAGIIAGGTSCPPPRPPERHSSLSERELPVTLWQPLEHPKEKGAREAAGRASIPRPLRTLPTLRDRSSAAHTFASSRRERLPSQRPEAQLYVPLKSRSRIFALEYTSGDGSDFSVMPALWQWERQK